MFWNSLPMEIYRGLLRVQIFICFSSIKHIGFIFKKSKLPRFFNLIVLLSIFSNLAILFFETTEQTQLAMNEQVNSFGVMANYAEVNYVTGVIKSFLV